MGTIINLILCCLLSIAKGKHVKIVHGFDAEPGEKLYTVSIQSVSDSSHFCGGSIYNENYVITAAHCIEYEYDPSTIQVTTGIDNARPTSVHEVTHMQMHEKYNDRNSIYNDIALLKVTPPFELKGDLTHVDLPEPHLKIPPKQQALLSGWGRLKSPWSGNPTILKNVVLTVVDEEYCRNIYENDNNESKIYSVNLCTHETVGPRRGGCSGDSGGPLTMNETILIGVVSWSRKDPYCASQQYPGVYTRVSEYTDWIKKHAT